MEVLKLVGGGLLFAYLAYMGFTAFGAIEADNREAASYKAKMDAGTSNSSDEYFYKRAKNRATFAPLIGSIMILAGIGGIGFLAFSFFA